ncbi:hypothetical protein G9A89_009568 [Geosiphon pyriformis]|nr:hypothetical protein G9A89_009568 [Geosiphon pyriformis]
MHNTNAASHSLVKIDLKIALEIPLHRKHHHDTTKQFGQTLQNKITRKDCLSYLPTPSQNTPINSGINGFGSSRRENVSINFTEKNTNIANLYLSAKAHKHFKIPIHNPTEYVIEIPEGILIGSISLNIQHPKKPQSIPDFAQLFLFCDITLQVWNLPKESYLFTPEEINKLNLENLSTLQQMQLKVFLNYIKLIQEMLNLLNNKLTEYSHLMTTLSNKKSNKCLTTPLVLSSSLGHQEKWKDSYPTPLIQKILDNLEKKKWFSSLNLVSGYWQVEIDLKDKEKTAFTT